MVADCNWNFVSQYISRSRHWKLLQRWCWYIQRG